MSSFAARLRVLRLKKGLSLQDLADSISVSKAHVWDLERGHSKNPTMGLLTALAEKLDTTVAFLVGESKEDIAGDGPALAPLFRDLRKLNPDDLETIQNLAEHLRKKRGDTSESKD